MSTSSSKAKIECLLNWIKTVNIITKKSKSADKPEFRVNVRNSNKR